MSIEIMQELAHRLYENPTLEEWAKLFSSLTWNKISLTHSTKRLRISETTFTQDLVFSFWLMAKDSDIPIEIYESTDEKSNGNDLEIYIETTKGYILLPTQCKLIRRNGAYGSIGHKVKGNEQIDLLLSYAAKKGGFPLYLFYNHFYNPPITEPIEVSSGFPIECFGCSIASANYIKQEFFEKRIRKNGTRYWRTPTFLDLHPDYALPFHQLAEQAINDSIQTFILQLRTGIVQQQLKYYDRSELDDKINWLNLAPPPAIGFIPGTDYESKIKRFTGKEQPTFLPAFRIVISFERRKLTLKRYI